MFRLILSVVFLVILVFIVVLNAKYDTSFNVFGWKVQEVPVIAVTIVSFILGVFYSFFYYLLGYFARVKKEKMKTRSDSVKKREKDLKGDEGKNFFSFFRRRKDSSVTKEEDKVEKAKSNKNTG